MKIEKISDKNRGAVMALIENSWGDKEIISRGKIYDCEKIPGFIINIDDKIAGYLFYALEDSWLEIVVIESLEKGIGIGKKLIAEAERVAKEKEIDLIKLITSNDNTDAFTFYQKCGFRMTNIYKDAMTEARKVKPSIPLYGNNGIEMRDEIEFEKILR